MSQSLNSLLVFFSISLLTAHAQQQCYYGAGAENRGPASLVPCLNTGQSACCLLGDVCLSGNACWNWATGNTYQYGCTDITYQDESRPYKCGFNSCMCPCMLSLSINTNEHKPSPHGPLSNIVKIHLEFTTHGCATHLRAADVNGISARRCFTSSLEDARIWARMRESLSKVQSSLHLTSRFLRAMMVPQHTSLGRP